MKFRILVSLTLLFVSVQLQAQRNCAADTYRQQQLDADPALQFRIRTIEEQIRNFQPAETPAQRTDGTNIITIPVVVHVLYHFPSENISDAAIQAQLAALNRDFRKKNADTTKIPSRFAAMAADCEIEFKLAISDPLRRSTRGIVRKYTPVTSWTNDDKIKSSAEFGDDAWDSRYYLNIWVGNLRHYEGYSSFPGAAAAVDGVVLHYGKVGSGLDRTGVHETGHWLGLFHLWGTENCGDDLVGDTPKQKTFTPGCPTGVRTSCGSNPSGDMYMNYMDYTSDECVVLFTTGQKQRMQAQFAQGGTRQSILFSKGLERPLIQDIELPQNPPRWLDVKIYPNPVQSVLTLNFEYDVRWLGRPIHILSSNGQLVGSYSITAAVQSLNLSHLKPGLYFIRMEKSGEKILQRFIKQ
jgi:Secretion system C-terminal sorting domain/Pregnancy-associated plasma protein-A